MQQVCFQRRSSSFLSRLHDRRFMSQAGRTRYFARSARRGEEKIFIFLFPSPRSCHAPREISRSPRLAHKAPVMQANFSQTCIPYWLAHTLQNGNIFSSTSYPYARTMSVKPRADQTWNIFVLEFYISISAVQTSLLQVKGKFTPEGLLR